MKNLLSGSPGVIAAAFFLALVTFFFGERMTPFGMLGDEKLYYLMTRDFPQVASGVLSDYYVQRLLPSGLVHHCLKLFSQPLSVENVILVYGLWNIVLTGLTAWLWTLVCGCLEISRRGMWLGFIGLFVNFAVLKYVPYTQVSTDMFAYTSGIALLYFYLKDRLSGLIGVTVLASFVWPAAVYVGLVLILLPRDERSFDDAPAPLGLNWAAAVVAAGLLVWRFLLIRPYFVSGRYSSFGIFSNGAHHPLFSVIYLSLGLMVLFVVLGMGFLLNHQKFFRLEYWKDRRFLLRAGIALVLGAGLKVMVQYLAGRTNSFPVDYLLFNLISAGLIAPGIFWVAHVIYFGPLLACLPLCWKSVCSGIRSWGIGLVMCVALVLAQSLHSESRMLMMFYPLILPFLVKALDGRTLSKPALAVWAVLSLLMSKGWLMIHAAPWGADPFAFPNQYYYMNFGPHMSYFSYALQGGIVAVLTAAAGFWLYRVRRLYRSVPPSPKAVHSYEAQSASIRAK